MIQELIRKEQPDGSFIIQRIKNGDVETLKETTTDTGEVVSVNNELVTIQTITITRHIGEKITF